MSTGIRFFSSRLLRTGGLTILFLLLLVGLSPLHAGLPASSSASKTEDRDRLMELARTQGSVNVLIELRVPQYNQLISKSRSHKVRTPSRMFAEEGLKADAALAGAIQSVREAVLSGLGKAAHRLVHTYDTLPLMAMEITQEALLILEDSGLVERIQEDRLHGLLEEVAEPKAPLENPWEGGEALPPALAETVYLVGGPNAWNLGYTGAGWYVAVLDTGIRRTHEMFQGKNLTEACFSARGNCPGGKTQAYGVGSAQHYESLYMGYDHGTHVAGIAAGSNGHGLSGVAPDADLIAVQVFSRFTSGECGGSPCVMSYSSDQIKALEYVYQLRSTHAVASVNMSLGGGAYSSQQTCDLDYAATKTAIDNLRAVGIVTAIASGNNGYCSSISAPACISSALAVGASTDQDTEASFNNWQASLLDMFAPGTYVYSATGAHDSSYGSWSGTSMATPHVAGGVAVLRQKFASMGADSLIQRLTSTGVAVFTLCWGQSGSKPRMQLDSALGSEEPPPDTPSPPFDPAILPPILQLLLDSD